MKNKRHPLELRARNTAIMAHDACNQKYDNYLPYAFHLRMVIRVAFRFINLIPENDQSKVLAACWLHDTLEDTHLNYNDLRVLLKKKHPNQKESLDAEACDEVAELVFAVTNSKGRNRKERADDAYYEGIRVTPYAVFVKLCDRIANVTYSAICGSESKLSMYEKENEHFLNSLNVQDEYVPMLAELDRQFRGVQANSGERNGAQTRDISHGVIVAQAPK